MVDVLRKRFQFKDSQLKGNLKWYILRLLRIKGRTRQELVDKLSDMFLGYWQANNELIDINLSSLVNEDLVKYSEKHEITERGLDALGKEEREIEQRLTKGLSKKKCAMYSLWGNVGLSALEFTVGILSGSIGLIADAVHTGIDIVASAITWIGIKIDKEAQAALTGGIILCGIGAFIAYESVTNVIEAAEIHFQAVALVTIVFNIAVNGYFSFYKFYVGGRTRSISLVADAYHTKTDIWSSVAVLIGLLGATLGFFVLDAVAGAVVSLFIVLGGYELISESKKVMQGEDPKLEKFSEFLDSHLKVLSDRGTFVSLWFFNLQEMTREENLERVRKGFERRFPVRPEDKDYDSIYARVEEGRLVEPVKGKLRLTEKGRKELRTLAERQATYIPWLQSKSVIMNARKINWFAEGL